jgi:hypothetical protein
VRYVRRAPAAPMLMCAVVNWDSNSPDRGRNETAEMRFTKTRIRMCLQVMCTVRQYATVGG